jgi:peroxiredoxin
MNLIRHALFASATVLLSAPLCYAQVSESAITKQIDKLRSLSADQRSTATIKVAADITALPAGPKKVGLADSLAHLVTEGDLGAATLQAVAGTLSQALAQTPLPAKKDVVPAPYVDLAKLVRFKNVTVTLNDPLFTKAAQTLADNDAEIAKVDFTLKDLHGKKVTLSELRGKIVLVNFWATTCAPCRQEMADLESIYTRFQSQGLVILSLTDENPFKIGSYLSHANYHPTVLLDSDGKVQKLFHVDGTPRTFVFDRSGKLVAQSIDQCTQRQFLDMLSKTDFHS